MKCKHYPIFFLFILVSISSLGQHIGMQDIDESKVSPWNVKYASEYQFVYHFGVSELESDFILLVSSDNHYAQTKSGGWGGDKVMMWVYDFVTLTNVQITGNQFYSDEIKGEFIFYTKGQEKLKGLKLYDSGDSGSYEIGLLWASIQSYHSGKFTQASTRILNKEELSQLSKSDLKIMRNEIFARYGHKFIPEGKMAIYFKTQSWYKGFSDNVLTLLTELEKENIELIKQAENN